MTRHEVGTTPDVRREGAAAPVIQAHGLRCRYGDFVAVDGVDISVAAGELFALLGTNGAGKTTVVETLEGYRRPDTGTVRLLGRDPYRHRRALAGEVAMVLQDSGFAVDLTVAETLAMWQRLHPDRRATADPLAQVDLGHRVDVRVGQLSGGERRRLDLAMALATKPSVLFLDEPTTGMDPSARERTWHVLQGLVRGGCAVVLTTHYLEEAEALADRLAIMHEGRIRVSGTVGEVAASRSAAIRFDLAEPVDAVDLPGVDGLISVTGRRFTIRTDDLQADLYRVLSWAESTGRRLDRLSATEASLREVFSMVQKTDIGVENGVRS